MFLIFRVSNVPCSHMYEEKDNMQIRAYNVVISHWYSTRAVAQYFYPHYLSVLQFCAFFPKTFFETAE